MCAWYWILDAAGEPVTISDVRAWADWIETAELHVGDDTVDGVRVSTVFLGLDHSFTAGVPVLWETMVFGGPLDGAMQRYTSRADALSGHAATLARVLAAGQHVQLPQNDDRG